MPQTRIKRGRFWDASEIAFVRYSLGLGRDTITIKRALQAVCQAYEAGRALSDPSEIRQLIHSYLSSKHVVLRRWALKALGLIRHPDDSHRILNQLKVENDAEARNWGVAALLAAAEQRTIEDVCREAGLDRENALLLAARLYAPSHTLSMQKLESHISLDDDELTLRWAIFLIGYNKAPEELFHPRHSNDVFLGELNQHSSEELSEYSMWALWERPEYDASCLTLSLDAGRKRSPSVRKWLYRLATQSPASMDMSPETLSFLSRDAAEPAREGLAHGVVDLDPVVYASSVADWFTREDAGPVKEILLSSMAAVSDQAGTYGELVRERFKGEQPGSALRGRLLAASLGTPLYGELNQLVAQEKALTSPNLQLFVQGNLTMASGPNFNAGRDIKATNLVGGDMINSANHAVQGIPSNNVELRDALTQVLSFLNETQASDDEKQALASATQRLAEKPTADNRDALLGRLVSFTRTAAGLGTLVGGVEKISSLLQHLHF